MEDAGYAPLVCGGLERHDIVAVSARTARNAEAVLRDTEAVLPGAGEHFSEELEKGLPRSSAFLLAAYLFEECRGYGPLGRVDAAARRLRLSRRAHREISGTVRGTRLIREASGTGLASGAQRYRLVDGCGTSLPEALLLTRTLGGLDTASLRGIWSYAVGPYRRQKENPLVRGDDIVRALGVEPGPPVGRLLRLVEEARADGLVKTSDEALEYLKDTVRMTPAG
ncbi:MAG TPA: hypothetical protein PLW83_01225, partial [Deltaproteobacteria bacterium]|nr:hypothetical protein [Deltaproteobacteria bacterium]